MKFMAIKKTLLFFDKSSGDAGIISGADFDNVFSWIETGKN